MLEKLTHQYGQKINRLSNNSTKAKQRTQQGKWFSSKASKHRDTDLLLSKRMSVAQQSYYVSKNKQIRYHSKPVSGSRGKGSRIYKGAAHKTMFGQAKQNPYIKRDRRRRTSFHEKMLQPTPQNQKMNYSNGKIKTSATMPKFGFGQILFNNGSYRKRRSATKR